MLESRMHANVPVRFGRGRLDSLGNKGLAAYLIAGPFGLRAHVDGTEARKARCCHPPFEDHRLHTMARCTRLLVMTSPRRVGSRIEAKDQFPPEYQGKTRLLGNQPLVAR
jgi:hypothetical protein